MASWTADQLGKATSDTAGLLAAAVPRSVPARGGRCAAAAVAHTAANATGMRSPCACDSSDRPPAQGMRVAVCPVRPRAGTASRRRARRGRPRAISTSAHLGSDRGLAQNTVTAFAQDAARLRLGRHARRAASLRRPALPPVPPRPARSGLACPTATSPRSRSKGAMRCGSARIRSSSRGSTCATGRSGASRSPAATRCRDRRASRCSRCCPIDGQLWVGTLARAGALRSGDRRSHDLC